jgi:PncC family amidohydrolase
MNSEIDLLAFIAVENLRGTGLTVTTAESCTGGMIASAITEVPGASQVFRYGWVTYCNEAKERLLNVPTELIDDHSVVSEPVVAAMATAAMRQSGADIAVAVSGNAGPTAAEGEPAVGTVCIALVRRGAARPVHTETVYLPGMNRRQLRQRVTAKVLQLIAGAAQ